MRRKITIIGLIVFVVFGLIIIDTTNTKFTQKVKADSTVQYRCTGTPDSWYHGTCICGYVLDGQLKVDRYADLRIRYTTCLSFCNNIYNNNGDHYTSAPGGSLTKCEKGILSSDETVCTFTSTDEDCEGTGYTASIISSEPSKVTCQSGEYHVANEDECRKCPAGSYSDGGEVDRDKASSCTVCGKGLTTSGEGATSSGSCKDCYSTHHVVSWEQPAWDNGTISNLCKISSCETGWRVSTETGSCVANYMSLVFNGCTDRPYNGNTLVTCNLSLNTNTGGYEDGDDVSINPDYVCNAESTCGGDLFVRCNGISLTGTDASKYTVSSYYHRSSAVNITGCSSSSKITITANANGGMIPTTTDWTVASDGKSATKKIDSGSTYGTLPTPTKDNDTFIKWNTKSDGTGTDITSDKTVSSSITIYAIWSSAVSTKPIRIYYNANGGTFTGSTYKSADGWVSTDSTNKYYKTVENNDRKELDNVSTFKISRTGYTPKSELEWCTAINGGGSCFNQDTSYTHAQYGAAATDKTDYLELNLYVNWTGNTYTVTFDKQSGTGGTNTVSVTYGSVMPSVTMPTRSGYTFGGYFKNKDGQGKQYYNSDGTGAVTWDLTSNTTLYASWNEVGANIPVTIVEISPKPAEVNVGDSVQLTATITPDNAINKAVTWSSSDTTIATVDSTGKVTGLKVGTVTITVTTQDGNKTDTAQVTVKAAGGETITHSITFDCNGGTGSMTPISVNFGQTVTLPTNSCSKNGYTFSGWNTSANGNGTSYADGASIDYTLNDDLTLIAQWNSNSTRYLIHYDANGGTGSMTDTEATSDIQGTLRENTFKYSGHRFIGWKAYYKNSNNSWAPLVKNNIEVEFNNKANFVNLYGPNGEEVTLFAQWISNPNTGIFTPIAVIGGLLLVSALGYYFVKKKNITLG